MKSKLNLLDCLELLEILHSLRKETMPINNEVDPLTHSLMWCSVENKIIDFMNEFKDQLIDKDSLEKLYGRKIDSYQIQYDQNGFVSGIVVKPMLVPEFINIEITIKPTTDGTNLNQ